MDLNKVESLVFTRNKFFNAHIKKLKSEIGFIIKLKMVMSVLANPPVSVNILVRQ
jgi:hypothetical protein